MADDVLKLASLAGGGLLVGHLLAQRKRHRDAEQGHIALAAHGLSRVAAARKRPAERPALESREPSRQYDEVFAECGHELPVAYLRALAYRESGLRPQQRTGSAIGILQVTPVVLRDFNRRESQRYTERDLLDPAYNVTIATSAIRTIVKSYQRNHAETPNMREDWSNLDFVGLLTLGWNAGWSEAAGVGRVVRYLNEHQIYETVTIDSVTKMAKHAEATRHLSDVKKVAWCKSVVQLYASERERDEAEAAPVSSPAEAA